MRYLQALTLPSTLLAWQSWTSGIERVPELSLCYDPRHGTFINLCHIGVTKENTGQPSTTMNYVQFITKYSKTLTDKPLSKHQRDKFDVDVLKKPRNPRMTQRATERVPILSIWWDPKQEKFVNLDLFQTTANYLSFLSLCLVMAFHSIFLF